MGNLLIVLGGLLVALLILVPLLERFGKPSSEQKLAGLSRWIFPLMAVLLVLQLLSHYLF